MPGGGAGRLLPERGEVKTEALAKAALYVDNFGVDVVGGHIDKAR